MSIASLRGAKPSDLPPKYAGLGLYSLAAALLARFPHTRMLVIGHDFGVLRTFSNLTKSCSP